MINQFVIATSQVLLVSLVVGAGLPAVFAIGVRALAAGGAVDVAPHDNSARSNRPATVLGVCCLALVVVTVALGITIMVATGLGKTVSFEYLWPLLVDTQ